MKSLRDKGFESQALGKDVEKGVFLEKKLVNVDLVCQSTPKEPLWTRVSRGAVATVITACGFVTYPDASEPSYGIGCNSDYRLRYKEKDITTLWSLCLFLFAVVLESYLFHVVLYFKYTKLKNLLYVIRKFYINTIPEDV